MSSLRAAKPTRASASPRHAGPSEHASAKPDRAEPEPINATWVSWVASASNLRVGAADDPLEREADRAADRVMSGPPRRLGAPDLSAAPGSVQRACCDGCDGEPGIIQRDAGPNASGGPAPNASGLAPRSVATTLAARAGRGRPLDRGLRNYFEPRFGADFSSVRVHTDGDAQTTARRLEARAFTHGDSLYFGAGSWSPDTSGGRRLIAHELAHVVQQRGGVRRIQRVPMRIRGEVGEGDREDGDADKVYFDNGSHRIQTSQDAALTRILSRLRAAGTTTIWLTGMASEEANSDALVHRRIASVRQRLEDEGFTDIRSHAVDRSQAHGQVDYRRQRYVHISAARSVQDPCVGASLATTRTADTRACETAFTTAHPVARRICDRALAAVQAASPADQSRAQTGLGVTSTREVVDFVQQVRTQLIAATPAVTTLGSGGHKCFDRCDTSCSTTASGGSGGMSLCHPFYDGDLEPAMRPWVLIHESAHATGEFTDFQYLHHLGFTGLTPEQRSFNADSITRLIVNLGDTGRTVWNARQQPPALTGTAAVTIRQPLGTLAMALVLAAFDQTFGYTYTRGAYDTTPRRWPCVAPPSEGNKRLAMNNIRGRFGMTWAPSSVTDSSCSAPASTGPTWEHHVQHAAVVDRLNQMRDILKQDLVVNEAPIMRPTWRRSGGQWALDVPRGLRGDNRLIAEWLLHTLVQDHPDIETRFVHDWVDVTFASLRGADVAAHRQARTDRRAADPDWGQTP